MKPGRDRMDSGIVARGNSRTWPRGRAWLNRATNKLYALRLLKQYRKSCRPALDLAPGNLFCSCRSCPRQTAMNAARPGIFASRVRPWQGPSCSPVIAASSPRYFRPSVEPPKDGSVALPLGPRWISLPWQENVGRTSKFPSGPAMPAPCACRQVKVTASVPPSRSVARFAGPILQAARR